MHLAGDGEIYFVDASEVEGRGAGDAFGHHGGLGEDFMQLAALP